MNLYLVLDARFNVGPRGVPCVAQMPPHVFSMGELAETILSKADHNVSEIKRELLHKILGVREPQH